MAHRQGLPYPMTTTLLMLIFLKDFVVVLGGLQRFEKQPQYTEVNPNEDALLTCKIFNKKGQCSWQKDNKPVGIYAKKYEWAGRQELGDCSLWVRAATLDFDDGEWECQVTASEFTTQDALTSAPVRLVVRVAPQRPRIEYNSSQVLPEHNVTGRAGERTTIKCVSRYGNPPARLKWFLDGEELATGTNQTNSLEADNKRTWVASSQLIFTFSKQQHGRALRCVALHESHDSKAQSITVRLDIVYPPEARLEGLPARDVEEGRDVTLRCTADANPPAVIMWRRLGLSEVLSRDETLRFRPAGRRDSGTYACTARNSVGSSEPLSVRLDVKYSPHIESVGPDRLTTAHLFSTVDFLCQADGNPPPTYQWLQRVTAPDIALVPRGSHDRLRISNVTYNHQGEYVCRATNIISGTEHSVQSEAISLQVVGAPQVLGRTASREVVVSRGQDALLRLVVCADPRPRRAAWEWSSLKLEAGADLGRYRAEELSQEEREDCYEARLHVRQVDTSDSRSYYLAVENDRGADRLAVKLAVKEPVSMTTLLCMAVGSLLLLLLAIWLTVYAVRREKCCFGRKGNLRPSDVDREKNALDGKKVSHLDPSSLRAADGGLPSEAIYSTSPSRPLHTIAGSPDAMKNLHSYLNTAA